MDGGDDGPGPGGRSHGAQPEDEGAALPQQLRSAVGVSRSSGSGVATAGSEVATAAAVAPPGPPRDAQRSPKPVAIAAAVAASACRCLCGRRTAPATRAARADRPTGSQSSPSRACHRRRQGSAAG
eukprot:3922057-Alexandrium_andersonii.AAC.1